MMLQLSGLWINKTKDGKRTYMTGYMGNLKILVFKNDHKTEDIHPDYVMYLAEKERPAIETVDDENIPF